MPVECAALYRAAAEATASRRAVADATPPPLVRVLRTVCPSKDVSGEIVAVACIVPCSEFQRGMSVSPHLESASVFESIVFDPGLFLIITPLDVK